VTRPPAAIMGGDQLVAALAGDDFEERHGDGVRSLRRAIWRERGGTLLNM
jgi:hypothetical protein